MVYTFVQTCSHVTCGGELHMFAGIWPPLVFQMIRYEFGDISYSGCSSERLYDQTSFDFLN